MFRISDPPLRQTALSISRLQSFADQLRQLSLSKCFFSESTPWQKACQLLCHCIAFSGRPPPKKMTALALKERGKRGGRFPAFPAVDPRLRRERGQPGSPIALQPILQRSIRDLGFTSNRSKRPAVLEVSAQKLEALKRALARGLGKRSQLRHLEFLARPRKYRPKITQDNFQIHTRNLGQSNDYPTYPTFRSPKSGYTE